MDDDDLAPYTSFVGIPIVDVQSKADTTSFDLNIQASYCCSRCRGYISHMLKTKHSELLGASFVSINQVARKNRPPLYTNEDDTQSLSFFLSFFSL